MIIMTAGIPVVIIIIFGKQSVNLERLIHVR